MKYVDARGTEVSSSKLPQAVRKLIEVCDKIPDEEAWTSWRLSEEVDYSHATMMHHTPHPAMEPYRLKAKTGLKIFFANKKTAEKERKKNERG